MGGHRKKYFIGRFGRELKIPLITVIVNNLTSMEIVLKEMLYKTDVMKHLGIFFKAGVIKYNDYIDFSWIRSTIFEIPITLYIIYLKN